MCTTVHARCLQTSARPTRVLLYTRNTRTLPHGRHVYSSTRAPRDDRSEHARAPYTWARPPTCTPCRPPDRQPLRAPVVRLQYARAGHTWAHPPTCAPYTAVPVLTSARARRWLYYRMHHRNICSSTRSLRFGDESFQSLRRISLTLATRPGVQHILVEFDIVQTNIPPFPGHGCIGPGEAPWIDVQGMNWKTGV